mmetsp:Transcript_17415/g.47007  ORF Transcript_17415/g.47007 Transcript_17415/m.47007 type:complete len:203 (-) Transcript_17415:544-1152(-)
MVPRERRRRSSAAAGECAHGAIREADASIPATRGKAQVPGWGWHHHRRGQPWRWQWRRRWRREDAFVHAAATDAAGRLRVVVVQASHMRRQDLRLSTPRLELVVLAALAHGVPPGVHLLPRQLRARRHEEGGRVYLSHEIHAREGVVGGRGRRRRSHVRAAATDAAVLLRIVVLVPAMHLRPLYKAIHTPPLTCIAVTGSVL